MPEPQRITWTAKPHSRNAGSWFVDSPTCVIAAGLSETNARLIAEAPAMRDALTRALDEIRAILARIEHRETDNA